MKVEMYENIGKKFRVIYDGYITKNKYEIVALDYNGYIIGFNYDFNNKDMSLIKGWSQGDGKYGNKYKLFWLINKNGLVKENKSYLEIE